MVKSGGVECAERARIWETRSGASTFFPGLSLALARALFLHSPPRASLSRLCASFFSFEKLTRRHASLPLPQPPLLDQAPAPLKRAMTSAAVLITANAALGTREEAAAAARAPLTPEKTNPVSQRKNFNHNSKRARRASACGGLSPSEEESCEVSLKMLSLWEGSPTPPPLSMTEEEQRLKKEKARKAKVARAAAAPFAFVARAVRAAHSRATEHLKEEVQRKRAKKAAAAARAAALSAALERKRAGYEMQMRSTNWKQEEEEEESKTLCYAPPAAPALASLPSTLFSASAPLSVSVRRARIEEDAEPESPQQKEQREQRRKRGQQLACSFMEAVRDFLDEELGGEKLDKDAAWHDPADAEFEFDLDVEGLVCLATTEEEEVSSPAVETTTPAAAAFAAAEEVVAVSALEAAEAAIVESLRASLAALSAVSVVDNATGAVVSGLAAALKEEKELSELEARERAEAEAERTYFSSLLEEQLDIEEAEEVEAAREAELRFSPRSALPLCGGGIRSEAGSPCSPSSGSGSSPAPSSSSAPFFEIEELSDDDEEEKNDDDRSMTLATPFEPFERLCRRALDLCNAEVELALALGERAGVELLGPTVVAAFRPELLPFDLRDGSPRRAVGLFDLWVPIFGGSVRVLVTRPRVFELF